MKKEASIIIHKLKTAIDPKKQLMEIWREINEYDQKDKDETLDDLDDYRQECMAKGEEDFGVMLEQIITDIRIGVEPPKFKNVPKQF